MDRKVVGFHIYEAARDILIVFDDGSVIRADLSRHRIAPSVVLSSEQVSKLLDGAKRLED